MLLIKMWRCFIHTHFYICHINILYIYIHNGTPCKMTRNATPKWHKLCHYNDVMMTTMASQITSLTVVYSTVYSDADQRKHQSSASLAFVWGIHRTGEFPHIGPATRKMFPFDDVIMPFHWQHCQHWYTFACHGLSANRCLNQRRLFVDWTIEQ